MPFDIDYWHWLAVATAFGIVEVLAPGFFFMWLAVAAVVMALLVLVLPSIGWEVQVLLFTVLAVSSALAGRRFIKRHPITSDQPFLNQRGAQYVGRTYTLAEGIVNGAGKLRVDDSIWKVRGEDCPAGTNVKVTSVDGTVLLVERQEATR